MLTAVFLTGDGDPCLGWYNLEIRGNRHSMIVRLVGGVLETVTLTRSTINQRGLAGIPDVLPCWLLAQGSSVGHLRLTDAFAPNPRAWLPDGTLDQVAFDRAGTLSHKRRELDLFDGASNEYLRREYCWQSAQVVADCLGIIDEQWVERSALEFRACYDCDHERRFTSPTILWQSIDIPLDAQVAGPPIRRRSTSEEEELVGWDARSQDQGEATLHRHLLNAVTHLSEDDVVGEVAVDLGHDCERTMRHIDNCLIDAEEYQRRQRELAEAEAACINEMAGPDDGPPEWAEKK